jgi:hypothetical protein
MVVKHGRSPAPDVEVVARHFGHLVARSNAVYGNLIRALQFISIKSAAAVRSVFAAD